MTVIFSLFMTAPALRIFPNMQLLCSHFVVTFLFFGVEGVIYYNIPTFNYRFGFYLLIHLSSSIHVYLYYLFIYGVFNIFIVSIHPSCIAILFFYLFFKIYFHFFIFFFWKWIDCQKKEFFRNIYFALKIKKFVVYNNDWNDDLRRSFGNYVLI